MQEMRAGYLKEMDSDISRLIPQVKYWEEDLPEQHEDQPTAPRLIRVNEINDTWMEIPRYENIWWGGLWLFSFVFLIPFILSMMFLQLPGFYSKSPTEMKFFLVLVIFLYYLLFFSVSEWLYLSPEAPRFALTASARKCMSTNISAVTGTHGHAGRQ